MNDLILVENLKVITDYRLLLCGQDPLAEKLEDWLTGSGLSVTVIDTPRELESVEQEEGFWLFLPKNALDDWQTTVSDFMNRQEGAVMVSTLGALHYALTISGVQLFTKEKRHLLMDKIRKEQIDTMDQTLAYMSRVVLTDADVEEVRQTLPVLAYGNAKVGTTSIYDSLQAAGISSRHIHSISGEKIIETLQNLPERVKIICGVREPLSRDLSLFFQTQSFFDRYVVSQGDFKTRVRNMMRNMWKTTGYLMNNEPSPYGMAFGWFDRELKDNFGLDISEQPFDREKGYTVYRKGNLDVFLYRLEDLDNLEAALQDFLGREDFRLLHTNSTAEKNIANIYQELKKIYRYPEAQVQIYYKENERMDYFYTKEEQASFLERLRIR